MPSSLAEEGERDVDTVCQFGERAGEKVSFREPRANPGESIGTRKKACALSSSVCTSKGIGESYLDRPHGSKRTGEIVELWAKEKST